MRDFFSQLRKRNVIKVGIAYLVVAWLVLQLADVIFPAMHLPEWSTSLALGLLIVGFPVALVLSWVFDITPSGVERASVVAESPDGPSIAVLPFPDMSAERDQEHFCDGLTEELLNVLTRIPKLRVASRTSSFSFKGKEVDLKAAADKLQVAHILEGSVRKSGDQIRVTAQLIEAATDSHLWSETYDRTLDDIFAIQDDIAAHILEALKCRLAPDQLPTATTQNSTAYQYFLRGRGYALSGAKRETELAVDMFEKAIDADPLFLRAWVQLAEQCSIYVNYFSKDDRYREIADRAADRATELAPNQAESHLARGYAHATSERFAESELELRKTLELDPALGRAWYNLGRVEQHQGKIEQAIVSYEKATEFDPDDYESPLLATTMYFAADDLDGAQRIAKIGVERVERILADYPDNQRAYYLGAGGLLMLNEEEKAKAWSEHALQLNPDDPATRYNSACFFAKWEETHERALDLLENSVISRTWIENDADLDPLRDYPRFRAILDTLPD